VTELHPDDDAHTVLVRADNQLYAAKDAGRNRVR
jgi:PleD family two-component response regulator